MPLNHRCHPHSNSVVYMSLRTFSPEVLIGLSLLMVPLTTCPSADLTNHTAIDLKKKRAHTHTQEVTTPELLMQLKDWINIGLCFSGSLLQCSTQDINS